ncbi:hypothetical protein O181_084708 [Austropuccinia psidii MF-1]|uniref:Uncharacterized protein n=1 Tax=Austropuccinia psidii MF-1 TaxID=1389203 RepID=A0A9Q3FW44_9BASI|nr:hypothetical protein [Austropuccinia psidii MF-1]
MLAIFGENKNVIEHHLKDTTEETLGDNSEVDQESDEVADYSSDAPGNCSDDADSVNSRARKILRKGVEMLLTQMVGIHTLLSWMERSPRVVNTEKVLQKGMLDKIQVLEVQEQKEIRLIELDYQREIFHDQGDMKAREDKENWELQEREMTYRQSLTRERLQHDIECQCAKIEIKREASIRAQVEVDESSRHHKMEMELKKEELIQNQMQME